jgi:hypothetical protein
MLGLSEQPEEYPPGLDPIAAQAELDHLQHLIFSFEAPMDKEPSKGGPSRGRRGGRSALGTRNPSLGSQSGSPSTPRPIDTSHLVSR